MRMLIHEFKENPSLDVFELDDEMYIYKHCVKFRKLLNKRLETNYRRVYVNEYQNLEEVEIKKFYVLTNKFRVLTFVCSMSGESYIFEN